MDNVLRLINVIRITARTGQFFAKCDGCYDDSEARFVNGFVGAIEQIGNITAPAKRSIANTLDQTATLGELIRETNLLLGEYDEQERAGIKNTLSQFVQQIMKADGKLVKAETDYYEEWLGALL